MPSNIEEWNKQAKILQKNQKMERYECSSRDWHLICREAFYSTTVVMTLHKAKGDRKKTIHSWNEKSHRMWQRLAKRDHVLHFVDVVRKWKLLFINVRELEQSIWSYEIAKRSIFNCFYLTNPTVNKSMVVASAGNSKQSGMMESTDAIIFKNESKKLSCRLLLVLLPLSLITASFKYYTL